MAEIPLSVTMANNADLVREIKESEVNEAVWGLEPDKAPGPDGLSIAFFINCWDFIKSDLCKKLR